MAIGLNQSKCVGCKFLLLEKWGQKTCISRVVKGYNGIRKTCKFYQAGDPINHTGKKIYHFIKIQNDAQRKNVTVYVSVDKKKWEETFNFENLSNEEILESRIKADLWNLGYKFIKKSCDF